MRLPRRAVPLLSTALCGAALLGACTLPSRTTRGAAEAPLSDGAAAPQPRETYTLPPETPATQVRTRQARVTHIVDGDTFDVLLGESFKERVRFIGVDTPERGDELFAKASAYTASLAPVGSTVFLELDVEHRDRYGRLLAYVWLRQPRSGSNSEAVEHMLNAKLVRRGLAKTLTIQPNSSYADLFASQQQKAREDGLNLWGAPVFPRAAAAETRSRSGCHPSYTGKCLKPDSPDYDCAGGSGDGPDYVEGPVYVKGDDPYGLDGDGDGVACA